MNSAYDFDLNKLCRYIINHFFCGVQNFFQREEKIIVFCGGKKRQKSKKKLKIYLDGCDRGGVKTHDEHVGVVAYFYID